MLTPNQVLESINNNAIRYQKIVSDKNFIKVISQDERDFNIFIPVRGRFGFFKPFINYLKIAAQNSMYKVKTIIIENDTKPTYDKLLDKDIDYVFIPTIVSQSQNMFAKALCYNIGFMLTKKTKWNIFHDLDILVDIDFFQNLSIYIDKNPNWIQPYSDKRVMLLTPSVSKGIVMEPNKHFILKNPINYTKSKQGCPGGSIIVKSNDFISVGGYDPEIFWGYSPEDSFFWTKLELIYQKIEYKMTTHFHGSATFADNPSIDVYHLYHPLQSCNNPQYDYMLELLDSFWKFRYEDRKKIIDCKREFLVKGFN